MLSNFFTLITDLKKKKDHILMEPPRDTYQGTAKKEPFQSDYLTQRGVNKIQHTY